MFGYESEYAINHGPWCERLEPSTAFTHDVRI